jgi:hypothetical protein
LTPLARRAPREEHRECSIVTTLDGRVLSGDGDLRAFFNYSARSLLGRNLFSFIDNNRVQVRAAIGAVGPNVTIDTNVVLRPRDRKPVLARALMTRQLDDQTVRWEFSAAVAYGQE